MSLLSRYAENLFWLARHTERAGSLAGTIAAHASFDQNRDVDATWSWLLKLFAEDDVFAKAGRTLTEQSVLDFYILDTKHVGSVHSNIRMARENARVVRAVIPNEVWEQMNRLFNDFQKLGPKDIRSEELARTSSMLRSRAHAQIGAMSGTCYRDEGWQFYKLGLLVEKTDQTSRLLDFKFAQRAAMKDSEDSDALIADEALWALVLRCAGAHQAFHRIDHRLISSESVVSFLIRNAFHPRSVTHCVAEIRRSLEWLLLRVPNSHSVQALDVLERMESYLNAYSERDALVEGLHGFNDELQKMLIELTTTVSNAYFLSGQPALGSDSAQDANSVRMPDQIKTQPDKSRSRQTSASQSQVNS